MIRQAYEETPWVIVQFLITSHRVANEISAVLVVKGMYVKQEMTGGSVSLLHHSYETFFAHHTLNDSHKW